MSLVEEHSFGLEYDLEGVQNQNEMQVKTVLERPSLSIVKTEPRDVEAETQETPAVDEDWLGPERFKKEEEEVYADPVEFVNVKIENDVEDMYEEENDNSCPGELELDDVSNENKPGVNVQSLQAAMQIALLSPPDRKANSALKKERSCRCTAMTDDTGEEKRNEDSSETTVSKVTWNGTTARVEEDASTQTKKNPCRRGCIGAARKCHEKPPGKESGRNSKSYCCDQCPKKYTSSSALLVHKHLVHSNDKRFKCDVCDEAFSQEAHLIVHQRTHSENRRFMCGVCCDSFTERADLNQHRKCHKEVQNFPCDVCHKQFKLKHHLNEHALIHRGEKPFVCTVCGKGFNKVGNLNVHVRTHNSEKPFACSHCEKTFCNRTHLKQHERIHLKEKPYCCVVCGHGFSQRGNWKRHVEKVHAATFRKEDDQ